MAGFIFGVAIVVALLVAIQIGPEWQLQRAQVKPVPQSAPTLLEFARLQDEMRKTVIQVVGGIFAILAIYLTFRRVRVTEQGHITDRYSKAIELLGALRDNNEPNIEVRLGAVYALERIAHDSARDHWTIMEVLTAYVRHNAPMREQAEARSISGGSAVADKNTATLKTPPTEIQAILTVLGRRRRDGKRESKKKRLDLSQTDLRGANLWHAHLKSANFSNAHLDEAEFWWADLSGARFRDGYLDRAKFWYARLDWADFRDAYLKEAVFSDAHFQGADFSCAHLDAAKFPLAHLKEANFEGAYLKKAEFWGANLEKTNLRKANLEEAIFSDARLDGADFRNAKGLTADQIRKAKSWKSAKFDDLLRCELGLIEAMDESPEDSASEDNIFPS